MNQSIEITELSPHEIPQACNLFQRVFGHTVSPDHWRWKYALGPREGGLNLVARKATGELVGHAGASIFPGGVSGDALSMAQVCDVMVGSEARGGLDDANVYPRLISALQLALRIRYASPYAYGFAGVRPFKLGSRLGYYRELQLCRPNYFVEPAAKPWTAALWQAREIGWDLARLDRLWSRCKADVPGPLVFRTGAYLAWRYESHPVNRYTLWVLSHMLRDRGWMVTRTMPNGEICIVDALFAESIDPRHLVAALSTALAQSLPATPHIYAWFLPSDGRPLTEPVIGSEVKINQWHTQFPSPRFQPGDTDVY